MKAVYLCVGSVCSLSLLQSICVFVCLCLCVVLFKSGGWGSDEGQLGLE